jgi:L-ascorbate metabolism protein UlaG (beta-lactamase superfamily)
MITFLLLVVFFGIVLYRFRGTGSYTGPLGNNFDGRKFQNKNRIPQPTLLDLLKWRFGTDREPWPKQVIHSDPVALPSPGDGEMVVTYVNHASCLIQVGNFNILTDPHYSERASPVSWAGPKRVHEPGIAYENLPSIHVVLISHDHYDHMDKETLMMLERDHKPIYLTGLGCDSHMKTFGLTERVKTLDWWQAVTQDSVKFTFVPAQHFSGRGLFDMDHTLWGGFVVEANHQKLYFAGDTGYGPHFTEIHERFGAMDVSLIPIGAYHPRWFMGPRHMDPEEAVLAHIDLKSKLSIGIHFQTFHLTDEGYDQPVIDLELAKTKYNIVDDRFIAPKFGESFIMKNHARESGIRSN